MVLRTVYLHPEADRKLRELAYRKKITKNQVIRDMIRIGLEAEAHSSRVGTIEKKRVTVVRAKRAKTTVTAPPPSVPAPR